MKDSKLNSTKIWQKIELVINTLKLDLVEHGTFLKKFVEKTLASESQEVDTSQFFALKAFCDLPSCLHHLLNTQSSFKQVLIHPLCPEELVDWLYAKTELVSLDIEKSTLHWDIDLLKNFVRSQTEIDLVVFYVQNGLCRDILEGINELKKIKPNIKTLVFADIFKINNELRDLILAQVADYFVWKVEIDKIDLGLEDFTETSKLQQFHCFLGWQKVSTDDIKILKIAQIKHYEQKRLFLEAYLFALLEKYKKYNLFKGFWTKQLYVNIYTHTKFKKYQEAIQEMSKQMSFVMQGELLDLFFYDVQISQKEANSFANPRKLYDILIKQLERLPEGTLEIPPLFLDREYAKYFFYATDFSFWKSFFAKKGLKLSRIEVSDLILDDFNLETVNFVYKYGLTVDL